MSARKEFVMPFGLQPTHLIIILVVALLIFGPSRLPEIGKAVGKTIREFQSGIKEASQGFSEEVKPDSTKADTAKTEPQPVCKSCGKPIQAGAKFCPECGAAQ
jgi:sec-independent protein translocase protein TatA